MNLKHFLLLILLGLRVVDLWGNESFLILKPFGFSSYKRDILPSFSLRITEDMQLKKEPIFRRSSVGDSLLSFPQEKEWVIIPFQNFFRKEIFKKESKVFISKDFKFYLGDIVSLYLYDNSKRRWVNPLLIENLSEVASLTLKEVMLEQGGERQVLNSGYPVSISIGRTDLLLDISSKLMGGRLTGEVGLYSLSVSVNGDEWLTFFAQSIREKDNEFSWEGLDHEKGSYTQGVFRLKNLPLKVGLNKIRIEVKNFLYRSLVFKGFIKVLGPLVH